MLADTWAASGGACLSAEKQEADRKRIEAQGISDFQKIVSEVGFHDLRATCSLLAPLSLPPSSHSSLP